MIISIIGGSGSGKDTQAKILSEKYGLPNLSVGTIARELAAKGNTEAIQAMEVANKGTWFTDDYVNSLIATEIDGKYPNGFIITGYPRSLLQAQSSEQLLTKLGKNLDIIIHIDVPAEVMLARMRSQAVEDTAREDTTTKAMLHRILSYIETIEPVLDYFRAKGNLYDVNGGLTIDEVNQEIVKILDQKMGQN